MSNLAIARLQKEVTMLQRDPPPGAWAGPIDGKPLTELDASIQGPAGTVYESGVFKLSIHIPTRYPMEPPKVRFVTPVYHPNIDAEGRICLDILNPPPKGAWKPSLNISTVLSSIALLLADPNPDDGLVTETTYEYKHQREVFDSKARAWTRRHAVQLQEQNGADVASLPAVEAAEQGPHVDPEAVRTSNQAEGKHHNAAVGQDKDAEKEDGPSTVAANNQGEFSNENEKAATGDIDVALAEGKRSSQAAVAAAKEEQRAPLNDLPEPAAKRSKLSLCKA